MNAPSQSDEARDNACLENTLVCNLPMELVLGILDAAIVQHRRTDLFWSLTLSLVCSAVRASALSIIYETIFLDVKTEKESNFVGWDNRIYQHAQLAFLSWLLNDSTAPPRQHIRHLIFQHNGQFPGDYIRWAGSRGESEHVEWPVELLTVRYLSDASCLYHAGLRPRRAVHIGAPCRKSDTLPSNLFEETIRDAFLLIREYQSIKYVQTWAGPPREEISNGRTVTNAEQGRMTARDFDPKSTSYLTSNESSAPHHSLANQLTVQLVDGDYLQQFPDLLLAGLAVIMKITPNTRIVLACRKNYEIAGQQVIDFIRGATLSALSQHALEGRLRVSHPAWTPMTEEADMFLTLVDAIQCYKNPWDEGLEV